MVDAALTTALAARIARLNRFINFRRILEERIGTTLLSFNLESIATDAENTGRFVDVVKTFYDNEIALLMAELQAAGIDVDDLLNKAPTGLAISQTRIHDTIMVGKTGPVDFAIVSATDPEGDACTFEIASDPSKKFELFGANLRASVGATFDASVTPYYDIRLRARDSLGLSIERAFRISVVKGDPAHSLLAHVDSGADDLVQRLRSLPAYVTHVVLSAVDPNMTTWETASLATSGPTWGDSLFSATVTPLEVKTAIAALRAARPGVRVALAIGGATFTAAPYLGGSPTWSNLRQECVDVWAGTKTIIQTTRLKAIRDMAVYLGCDLDLDYQGAMQGGLAAAVDAEVVRDLVRGLDKLRTATPGLRFGVKMGATGADLTANTTPVGASHWAGAAGLWRQVFALGIPECDWYEIASYGVGTTFWSPLLAYDQYAALVPATSPLLVGLHQAIVGSDGGADLMVEDEHCASSQVSTWLVSDQYGVATGEPYSVESIVGHVASNATRPKDGAMFWSFYRGAFPPSYDGHAAATATTAARKAASLLGLPDDVVDVDAEVAMTPAVASVITLSTPINQLGATTVQEALQEIDDKLTVTSAEVSQLGTSDLALYLENKLL